VIARRAEVTAHKEAHRADLEAASAQAVVDFLEHDLLAQAAPDSQAQPGTRPDPDLKVRTALDRASQGVSAKFKSQPEVEASVRETIGKTYKDLGFYPEALTQIERALELRRNLFGAEDPRTLETTASLGLIFMFQGKYAEAEKLLSPALEVSRRVLGPEDPATATMMNELATAYFEQDKVAQAEALWKQTLDLRRKLFGPESPKTLGTMNNLTLVSIAEGKFSQAESLDLALLEIHRRKEGPEQPETLGIMHNLAMDYLDEGKYAEALALFRQILPLKQSVMGPEHPETLAAKGDLAEAYAMSGQTTEAEKLLLEATTDMRRKLTREDPVTLGFLLKLGSLYQMEGKYGEARAVDAQALAGFEHLQGKENVEAVMASTDVAFADLSLGKFAESEARSQEALSASLKVDPDHWRRYWAESLLGASLAGEKKFTEAEPRLIEAYAGLTARRDRMPAPDRYRLRQTRTWIVDLYRDWGQPEKADAWSRK
jgi:tetratricopeptide (TPR) repeat protein